MVATAWVGKAIRWDMRTLRRQGCTGAVVGLQTHPPGLQQQVGEEQGKGGDAQMGKKKRRTLLASISARHQALLIGLTYWSHCQPHTPHPTAIVLIAPRMAWCVRAPCS